MFSLNGEGFLEKPDMLNESETIIREDISAGSSQRYLEHHPSHPVPSRGLQTRNIILPLNVSPVYVLLMWTCPCADSLFPVCLSNPKRDLHAVSFWRLDEFTCR